MRKPTFWLLALMLVLPLALVASSEEVSSAPTANLDACRVFAYSTEEDFITQGPVPADGSPIISDGDLLSRFGAVCLRNRELLQPWDVQVDLGLDAVDVLNVEDNLVAFSTELNHPGRLFSAGDLLSTWGTVIPNQSLTTLFQLQGDRGLDAVHFVGKIENIVAFHSFARDVSRDEWLSNPGLLTTELRRYGIDIWFSLEGTEMRAATVSILDGDLLSAAYGVIVSSNAVLLPPVVPAGLPARGVDFGLDAFSGSRAFQPGEPQAGEGYFSTEILYRGEAAFSDGDILKLGNGIAIKDVNLYTPLEPKAGFLGTDALFMVATEPVLEPYFPVILREYLRGSQQ